MKHTMAAVIVGPTIGASVSVFASRRGRCAATTNANRITTEAATLNTAKQRDAVGTLKAARRGLGWTAVDGARRDPDVDRETGMPVSSAARRAD